MRTLQCGGHLAIAITALALVASASIHAATQDAPAAAISGQWRLARPSAVEPGDGATPPREPESPEGREGGRRPGGGGGYGGGMRGRGGFGGGRGGEGIGGGGGASAEQMAKMRAVMREVGQPAAILNIVVSGDKVSFTTDQGVVRKFTANGRKEKIALGDVTVDCVTKWDRDTLTQEMKAGDMTITRTWQAVTDGQQLVVTTGGADGREGRPGSPQRRFMYDRNAAGNGLLGY